MDKQVLLTIKGLRIEGRSGDRWHEIVKGVDLTLHKGEVLGLIGESGSGKSTTARVTTGLLPPRRGEVLMGGKALPLSFKARSRDELRQCQMIYQMADTAPNPKLRLRELIGRPDEMYLGPKRKALEKRIRELLALIELEPDKYIDRLPSELSGGQKQRIGIARALAAEPQLFICDEVTSALDQIVQEGILKLLDRLQSELDIAYMFITHDLATVKSIADEVVVMHQGVVVERGPKGELFANSREDYTNLQLSSVPEMDPDWLNRLLAARGGTARTNRGAGAGRVGSDRTSIRRKDTLDPGGATAASAHSRHEGRMSIFDSCP
jgi:peptide/nickel transport system ATP-binding protein